MMNETTTASIRQTAEDAYVYGYAIVDLYRILDQFALDPTNTEFKAAPNSFFHSRALADPNDRTIVAMNVDTPYSYAWLDLRDEPIVLTVPPFDADRYVSAQLIDLYTYIVGYVSPRTNGHAGGTFLVTGPSWHGSVPDGITGVFEAPTDFMLVFVRTQLFDDDDLIRPEHVARLVEAVAAEPGHRIAYADVAASGYLLDYADVEMWLADGKRAHVFDVPYSPLLLSKDNLFPPMAALFSARLVREHGCAVDETLDFFEDWDFWRQVAQHTDFLRVPGITAVYRANLSASGVTGEGSPSADPRISRDREKVAQRLAALRDRYQRRVDELKAEARSARNAGDADRALAAWREAGRIDPYDVDAVLREAEAACAAGAWAEGRRRLEAGQRDQPAAGQPAQQHQPQPRARIGQPPQRRRQQQRAEHQRQELDQAAERERHKCAD